MARQDRLITRLSEILADTLRVMDANHNSENRSMANAMAKAFQKLEDEIKKNAADQQKSAINQDRAIEQNAATIRANFADSRDRQANHTQEVRDLFQGITAALNHLAAAQNQSDANHNANQAATTRDLLGLSRQLNDLARDFNNANNITSREFNNLHRGVNDINASMRDIKTDVSRLAADFAAAQAAAATPNTNAAPQPSPSPVTAPMTGNKTTSNTGSHIIAKSLLFGMVAAAVVIVPVIKQYNGGHIGWGTAVQNAGIAAKNSFAQLIRGNFSNAWNDLITPIQPTDTPVAPGHIVAGPYRVLRTTKIYDLSNSSIPNGGFLEPYTVICVQTSENATLKEFGKPNVYNVDIAHGKTLNGFWVAVPIKDNLAPITDIADPCPSRQGMNDYQSKPALMNYKAG